MGILDKLLNVMRLYDDDGPDNKNFSNDQTDVFKSHKKQLENESNEDKHDDHNDYEAKLQHPKTKIQK